MAALESSIQKIISDKGFKQRIVAEKAGFSQKAFSDMLHGRGTLKAQYIPDIARDLGVTPNELFGIDNSQKAS